MLSGVDRRGKVPEGVLRHAFPNWTGLLTEPYFCEVGYNGPNVVKTQLMTT